MAADIIILDQRQLRDLADMVWRGEADTIYSTKFKSESERVEFLTECEANCNSILKLLDCGAESNRKFANDGVKSPIANGIFEYIINGANSALQTVRNYTLRTTYLNKINEHVNSLTGALEALDGNQTSDVEQLAKEVAESKTAMLEYAKLLPVLATPDFARRLKQKGSTFEELVARYQMELGYGDKQFEDLNDKSKLEVFEKILEAAGDGSVTTYNISKWLFKSGGVGLFLFVIARVVWDVFTADHPIQKATKDAVVSVAAVGGAMLGKVIGTALASEMLGVESTVAMFFVGAATGFVGAFIVGAAIGFLMDLIIGSGGKQDVLSTEGHHVYVAEMPDGMALAYQIAHQDGKN